MSQRSSKKYQIDPRSAREIEEGVKKLSASYTPEWHFSVSDPDLGSVIGRIWARQMEENIRAVNRVPEVYHAEFVNLLDLTLKRAVPAESVAVFSLSDTAVYGTHVPAGTRVLTDTGGVEEEDAVFPVFETDRNLYVTASRITDIFQTDYEEGCIVPILGRFTEPALYESRNEEEAADFPEEGPEEENALRPFRLFGERGGIGRHALLLYHPTVFNARGGAITIDFQGDSGISEGIRKGKYRFLYLSPDGLQPFSSVTEGENSHSFRLVLPEKQERPEEDEESEEGLVILEALGKIRTAETVTDIRLSSDGDSVPPDYVGDGNGEMDRAEFAPFTDTLSLYSECYVGKTGYFDQPGSFVTLSFQLLFREHTLDLGRERAETELKIIKKKAQALRNEVVSDVYADQISIEYFNGIGWKRLSLEEECRSLFAEGSPGQIALHFRCPADWRPTESGAFHGRILRIRLLRSDNCYLRPAVHHYPVIRDLMVSYTCKGAEVRPERLVSISGTGERDITEKCRSGRPFPVFSPIPYTEDALYLGFDRPMEAGPVGLFFRLGEGRGRRGIPCLFEYSTRRGFRQIKVVDGTEGFTRSGIILFIPPPDFHAVNIEKKKRYWLRIIRKRPENPEERERTLPVVDGIFLNAMTVTNRVTGEMEDFYIEEALPNMRFALGVSNILDTEVWVNEKGVLTEEEIRQLKAARPGEVQLESDITGGLSAVYVLWRETERFVRAENEEMGRDAGRQNRVYRIDRLTGEILFGDGIHEAIPRVTDDTAFRVRLKTSAGEAGNLPPEALNSLEAYLPFVNTVTNPVRAYGGSNMESVREAMKRGADRIHSRGRMVSMGDYCRAIKRFSGVIDKVRGVTGRTIEGKDDPACLSFVLLMKDFAEGSFSFHRIEAELKNYLLSRCEVTVAPERLQIVEPVFVEVSVSVWTEVMNVDQSFEILQEIRGVLERYLDPVKGGAEAEASGWEIGVLPKKSQILMQLAFLKNQALIRKTSITAKYTDWEGTHETAWENLRVTPFMVCKSGEHHVHIMH